LSTSVSRSGSRIFYFLEQLDDPERRIIPSGLGADEDEARTGTVKHKSFISQRNSLSLPGLITGKSMSVQVTPSLSGQHFHQKSSTPFAGRLFGPMPDLILIP
jgi:hypothetical protein